ncbi:MAG: hypothetical protein ONB46_11925 [candidate division KSB1 bacterium]|nr:hypothetical protein [candidate division KSB1 bacterium]MDZ7366516.1 hypothetical protein [candidate division KSB1 bacterium]MDZ7404522.1 hypothetical protein [candidate division KSB1 bacterium]
MNKASRSARQAFIERPASGIYLNEASIEKSLEHFLVRLQHTTNWLRLSRIFAAVFTAINIFVALFLFDGLRENLFPDSLKSGNGFVIFVGLSLFVNLAVIVLFENLRRGGDALFEEISDKLHWYVGYRKQKENGAAANDGQPPDARLVLRAFAGAADLPLIPGKFGPAIYAGVNLVFALLFLYFRLKS